MSVKTLIDTAAKRIGTRYKLAKAMEVTPAQIYNWQTGAKPCSPADRARLAAFAGEDAVQELVRATMETTAGTKRGEQLEAVLGKWLRAIGAESGTVLPSLGSMIFGTVWNAAKLDVLRCIRRVPRLGNC